MGILGGKGQLGAATDDRVLEVRRRTCNAGSIELQDQAARLDCKSAPLGMAAVARMSGSTGIKYVSELALADRDMRVSLEGDILK